MSNLSEEIEHIILAYIDDTDDTSMTDIGGQFIQNQEIARIIQRQQKEIEELKKDKKALTNNYDRVLSCFISKDKIKEKIKELNAIINEFYNSGGGLEINSEFQYKIDVLKELLEESE